MGALARRQTARGGFPVHENLHLYELKHDGGEFIVAIVGISESRVSSLSRLIG
jgi:hypothetical protein